MSDENNENRELAENEVSQPVAPKSVSYFQLFRYSKTSEKVMIVFGCIFSLAVGAGDPLLFYLFGDIVNQLDGTDPNFAQKIYDTSIWFAVLALAIFCASFLSMFFLHYTAIQQTKRIRVRYFESILRQNIGWFDQQSSGTLISQLSEAVDAIENGIGSKLGLFLRYLSTFVVGLIVGFIEGWKLALVAVATLPLTLIAFGVFGFVMTKFSKMEMSAYAKASGIAGEVLSSIRTVVAFGGEDKECARYVNNLSEAEKVGIKKSTAIGGATGFLGCVIYCSAALIFWYGVKLTIEDNYDPGAVFIVFFNILLGTISIGAAMPSFQYFAAARASAGPVFETIERIPPIDKKASGVRTPQVNGRIEFRNVSFTYETRPDIEVLKKFSLTIEPGQTIALVGKSGSGKSTAVHLIQRFYDPTEGEVIIDGTDIRKMDLSWHRKTLGVVQQEPNLFADTVAENIRFGKLDATRDEIETAAKLANAHEFIVKMSQGYDTWLSEGGGSISGGQKQRIAIARALVRNPKILLLDEATSALDTRSERVVQAALNQARYGRTVVMVAHRLTTVQQADKILVVDRGEVKESGTHDELVSLGGIYARMLHAQLSVPEDDENEDERDDHSTAKMRKSEEVRALAKMNNQESDNDDDDDDDDNILQGSNISLRSVASTVASAMLVSRKRGYTMKRMMKYNSPEWGYTVGGCIGVIISALVTPAFLLIYSEIFHVFSLIMINPSKAMRDTEFFVGLMVMIAIFYLIGMVMQGYFFGVVGERLARRLREKLFTSILHQDMAWFDKVDNQPGILTTRLATEASSVRNVSGFQLGILLEAMVLLIAAFVIGFIDSWQVTLLLLVFVPFMMLGGYLEYKAMFDQGGSTKVKSRRAQIAQESFTSNRTLTTLGIEDYIGQKFKETLDVDKKKAIKHSLVFSALHGVAVAVSYLAYATAFPLGAYLMQEGQVVGFNVFRAFSAITFSLSSTGRVVAFIPDMQRASVAAKNIIKTLDRSSKIPKDFGHSPEVPYDGRVVFKNVSFRYATGKHSVLKNFSHTIDSNQSQALVGPSGCGKSTILQLLLRFYDIPDTTAGKGILLNGMNLRALAPTWIRRQIGLVSQEPNLFDLSIRENIAYGLNDTTPSMDDIKEAARQANIHDFIMTLPANYDTVVGEGGSSLSGGQKQRVAIARALLRKPRLLLLDEATSALDNQSERVVQEALDNAMTSRTCLMVAHRLTTVENADLIIVLEDGRVREEGTHQELMDAKGTYHALHCIEE